MWTNASFEVNESYRKTDFSNAVVVTARSINTIADAFNNIFGQLTDFSDSVSSVTWYPINLGGAGGTLNTPKGSFNVPAYSLKPYASYLYMGETFVERHFGDFRDYTDSTRIRIYLPMCGYFDIDPKECMGKYLKFRLSIDFITGRGLYIVGVGNRSTSNFNNGDNGLDPKKDIDMRIISTYEFQLGTDIPIGSTNAADIARNALLGAVKIAGSAALSVAMHNPIPAITTTTSVVTYDIQGRGSYKGARMKQMKSGTQTTTTDTITQRSVDKQKISTNVFEDSINLLNTNIPFQTSDRPNNSCTQRFMSRDIHILMYYKEYADDDIYNNYNYGHTFGFPLAKYKKLGSLKGYTTIGDIHFESSLDDSGLISSATQYEVDSIISKLKDGVIM